MLSHRRALITLTILALTAGSARAQDPAPGNADPGLGLKLKLQRSLLPPAAPDLKEDLPVFLEADSIKGTQDRYVEADGNVVLRRAGLTVFGDQLRYLLPTNNVTIMMVVLLILGAKFLGDGLAGIWD